MAYTRQNKADFPYGKPAYFRYILCCLKHIAMKVQNTNQNTNGYILDCPEKKNLWKNTIPWNQDISTVLTLAHFLQVFPARLPNCSTFGPSAVQSIRRFWYRRMSFPSWGKEKSPEVLSHRRAIKLNGSFFLISVLSVRKIMTGSPTARWKGFRVFGGDGSTLNLPASKQIRGYFGVQTNSSKSSLARILLVYDVLTGFTLQARLGRMSTGESGFLDECLQEVPARPDDLLVLDRNFGNFHMAHKMTCEGRPFCIRMSTGISNFAKAVMADSRMDFITEWVPSTSERETAKTIGNDTGKGNQSSSWHRRNRIAGEQSTGLESFKTEDLVELYGMRWGVGEGIKKLKPKIKVEQFGCRKPQGIYQDFLCPYPGHEHGGTCRYSCYWADW